MATIRGAGMQRRQAARLCGELDLHGLRARHGRGRAGATRAGGKPGSVGKWRGNMWEIHGYTLFLLLLLVLLVL